MAENTTPPEKNWLSKSISFWRSSDLKVKRLKVGIYFIGATAAGGILIGQVGIRYWLWPQIEAHKIDIENLISDNLDVQVSIGELHATWDGIRPSLEANNIVFLPKGTSPNPSNKALLSIPKIEATLRWDSLWHFSPRFHQLNIDQANIQITRDQKANWVIAGITVKPGNHDSAFLSWAFSENNLKLAQISVDFLDLYKQSTAVQYRIDQLEILNAGLDHHVNLMANSTSGQGKIQLNGKFTHHFYGRRTHWRDWEGNFDWQVEELNLPTIAEIVESPAKITSGTVTAQGHFELSSGQFTEGSANIRAEDLDIFWGKTKNAIHLKSIHADIKESHEKDFQFITANTLAWKFKNDADKDQEKTIRDISIGWITPGEDEPIQGMAIRSPHIDLTEFSKLALELPLPEHWLKPIRGLAPKGVLENFNAIWPLETLNKSPLHSLMTEDPRLQISAKLINVGWDAYSNNIPAVNGLTGELSTTDLNGSFKVASKNISVGTENFIGRKLTQADNLNGELSWHQRQGRWTVSAENLFATNSDVELSANGSYQFGATNHPKALDLNIQVARAKLEAFTSYLPLSAPEDVRTYLTGTLVSGELHDGFFKFKGNPEEVPFLAKTPGVFQFNAPIENGRYRPVPNSSINLGQWLPFESVTGNVSMNGGSLKVEISKAKFQDTQISDVIATADFSKKNTLLKIQSSANGSMKDLFAYIASSPALDGWGDFSKNLQISGDGKLKLKIEQSFAIHAPTKFEADLEFKNNEVTYGNIPPLQIHQGSVKFSEEGVLSADVNSNWLGESLTIKNQANTKMTLAINGVADIQKLLELDPNIDNTLGIKFKNRFQGKVAYRGSLQSKVSNPKINLDIDLKQASIDLPSPFNKKNGQTMSGQLTVETVKSNQNLSSTEWGLRLGDKLQSKGVYKNGAIEKHGISIGNINAALPQAGTAASVNLDTLDIEAWDAVLSNDNTAKSSTSKRSPSKIWGVDTVAANIKHLIVANRDISDVSIAATRANNLWEASVSSPIVTGLVKWKSADDRLSSGEVIARLSNLTIPTDDEGKETITTSIKKTSTRIPKLDITAEQFILGNRNLGSLDIKASNTGNSWKLNHLEIKNHAGQLLATGLWQMPEGNSDGQTNMKIGITSGNAGELMSLFGYPKAIENGEGKLSGNISWDGAPYKFNKQTLNGDLSFEMTKGKLLQVDPGAAKLLGILSFQSLFKLATLDIKGSLGDAVTSGTSFDKIGGTGTIEHGIGKTNNFEMDSSLAKMTMRGEANLINETQDLRVTIYPNLNVGSASVAAFYFVNPIVGLSALLGQYLISSQINKVFQADYLIQGSWKDPEIIPLDQKGQPIDPKLLEKIRSKALLKEQNFQPEKDKFSFRNLLP